MAREACRCAPVEGGATLQEAPAAAVAAPRAVAAVAAAAAVRAAPAEHAAPGRGPPAAPVPDEQRLLLHHLQLNTQSHRLNRLPPNAPLITSAQQNTGLSEITILYWASTKPACMRSRAPQA